MGRHPAHAVDGRLAGNPNLTVEETEDGFQAEVVWTSGPGTDERHLYRFVTVSVSKTDGGVPEYKSVRTLDSDEPDPA